MWTHLVTCCEILVCSRTWLFENLIYVIISVWPVNEDGLPSSHFLFLKMDDEQAGSEEVAA